MSASPDGDSPFDREIALDFCEVGASGARYALEDIKTVVLGRLAGALDVQSWIVSVA